MAAAVLPGRPVCFLLELTVHVGGTVAAAERFGAAVVESSAPASESGAPASESRPRSSAPPGSDWPADAAAARCCQSDSHG